MTLDDLGPRICIIGPSNSGKSTLAEAIGRSRGLQPVYLDQLHHLPNTDWKPRPRAEFIALHHKAIAEPRWVMDGNYFRSLPQRLERATGLILLDIPATIGLLRYLRRCWSDRDRRGGLDGGKDVVKWEMIRYIAINAHANRKRHREIFDRVSLPKIELATIQVQAGFFRAEVLHR